MVVAFSGTATSVAANTTSSDLATGTYQFVPRGIVTLIAKPTITGVGVTLKSNGIPICDNAAISNFGASGGMTQLDNEIVKQLVNPGRLELRFVNNSGNAATVDYKVLFDQTK